MRLRRGRGRLVSLGLFMLTDLLLARCVGSLSAPESSIHNRYPIREAGLQQPGAGRKLLGREKGGRGLGGIGELTILAVPNGAPSSLARCVPAFP